MALRIHANMHKDADIKTLPSAFTVTFVEKPRDRKHLDLLESKWINRLKAAININPTLLPKST